MLINWFTVFAQAINFLILVWLLKRFLYKPILQAIDEREKRIVTELADAEAKKAVAQKERDDFEHKNQAFDQERAALIRRAIDEATAERQQLLNEARRDADAFRAKRQEALQTEYRNLSDTITRWVQREVFAIARKTLADLANMNLEERISEVFVGRLRALDSTTKDKLAAALSTGSHAALVRSAFDLPAAQRDTIEGVVKESLGGSAQVHFEKAPELVSGIELSTNGQKVAWSIADYLATLATTAPEVLHVEALSESKPDSKAQPVPHSSAKPVRLAEMKPGPNREPEHGLKPVPGAPKANH
jgi:F-type H+-transporting ATPase subunit b